MGLCYKCNRDIKSVNENISRTEYAIQADYFGMESLTEEQQLLVEGKLCEECLE